MRTGNSLAITLPPIEKGEWASIAANRLMLVDPRGKIDEEKLLEFLEDYIEPAFWDWFRKRERGELEARKESNGKGLRSRDKKGVEEGGDRARE